MLAGEARRYARRAVTHAARATFARAARFTNMRRLRPSARPLLIAAALVVCAHAPAACGDDGGSGSVTSSTPTATATTATTARGTFDNALWPDPASATEQATPAAVARSFVEDFIGMPKPAFADFEQGDSRSGEIPMLLVGEDGRPRPDSVIASIALRQLDGKRWFVVAASSEQIRIDSPAVFDAISSPVTIEGAGRGFESNLVVSVHAAFEPKPLVDKPTSAGNAELAPFSATLALERPAAETGAIVVRDGGGLDGVATAFAATAVRFADQALRRDY